MNSETEEPKDLKTSLEEALTEKEVFVHFDGTSDGVSIPESLQGSSSVTLKLSHHFSGSLILNDNEAIAELLFPEGRITCTIPFKAIWGLTKISGETLFWPEQAPREVLEEMVRGAATQAKAEIREVTPEANEKKGAQKAGNEPKKKGSPAALKRVK